MTSGLKFSGALWRNIATPAGTILFDLDFRGLATDSVFTQVDLQAQDLDNPDVSISTFTPGFSESRCSIVEEADLPISGGTGGSALRVRSESGSYGVQDNVDPGSTGSGATCIIDVDDYASLDDTVAAAGLYAAGLDEAWIEIEMCFASNFSWNGASENGWKQWGGFLIGPYKDAAYDAGFTSVGGNNTDNHGRNTGGTPGNGDWYSGGSTRWMSRAEQPTGSYNEDGGIWTTYAYHADQQAGGGYGDFIYYCYDSGGTLVPGAASATANVRNPRASGGAAATGEYVNMPQGRWARFGQRCKLNTAGLYDGEVEAFLDGSSLGTQTGYRWRGSAAQNASGVDATWGIQAAALYGFSGGNDAPYAIQNRSDFWVRRVRVADYDFIST